MGIDPKRHIHCAVSGQILHFLDIQSRFKQAGDVGVAQNVGRDMGFGQFSLNQLPHTLVGRFRQRLMVLHGDDIL